MPISMLDGNTMYLHRRSHHVGVNHEPLWYAASGSPAIEQLYERILFCLYICVLHVYSVQLWILNKYNK